MLLNFGVILKATNSSFQKSMICYLSIYMQKVMKLHMNSPRNMKVLYKRDSESSQKTHIFNNAEYAKKL